MIDADYRGEVKAILVIQGAKPFTVKSGDRIAQLVPEKFTRVDCVQVTALSDTARGQSGLGSTRLTELPAASAKHPGTVE